MQDEKLTTDECIAILQRRVNALKERGNVRGAKHAMLSAERELSAILQEKTRGAE